jgi:hypothetical protein
MRPPPAAAVGFAPAGAPPSDPATSTLYTPTVLMLVFALVTGSWREALTQA